MIPRPCVPQTEAAHVRGAVSYIECAVRHLCQHPACRTRKGGPALGIARCLTCGEWACAEHGPQHSVGWRVR
jgi:hypothetical protein